MARLSIIICTYNRCSYLPLALNSFKKQSLPKDQFEIILVNNNSTDDTQKICEDFLKNNKDLNFRVILEKQQGLSFARNRGIKEASGEFLIFIDDDAEAEPDYLKNLDAHINNLGVEAGGGKIKPAWETQEPKWVSKFLISLVSVLDFGPEVILFKNKKFPIGANMFFSKELVSITGAFNTNLGRTGKNMLGGEEKDLFFRMQKMKIPIYYLPDVTVWHHIPEERTTKEFIKKQALGIGKSEKIRCLNIGKKKYLIRIILEIYKWAGSMVLFVFYYLKMQPPKANMILFFRFWVTKGLII